MEIATSTKSVNFSELPQRTLTAIGLVIGGIAISVIALKVQFGAVAFVAAGLIIAGLACLEIARLFARDEATERQLYFKGVTLFLLLILPSLVCMVSSIADITQVSSSSVSIDTVSAFGVSVIGLLALQVSVGAKDLAKSKEFSATVIPAFIFVTTGGVSLIKVAGVAGVVPAIWWVIAVTGLNDICAYFAGTYFGGPLLAPAISPKKTIAGSVAGFVGGTIVGIGLWKLLMPQAELLMMVCGTLGIIASAQVGDLAKSYLKRVRGVKDFGAILPGHGGVLDRFDALLASAPILLLILNFLTYTPSKLF